MIQVVLYLITVALVAAGFVWLADRPGDVLITWMGYRIETSFMVALLAIAALVVVAMIVWSLARGILRSPDQVSLFFRHRRAMKGHLAITRGLVAIGAGDLRVARRAADEAARLSPGDPLMLLLTAQSAQMAGDRGGAERAFHEMARHESTRLLGLRGLYIEAQRRNDSAAVRQFALEAAKAAPGLTWAGQAVLDDRCAATDWSGALEALEHMKSALDKDDYRRKRAVLLTARAIALDELDRDSSRALVLEAVKLAPDLVPAAALAGKRLAESGDARKASKILNTAWKLNPHPDIADVYANLRFGDSARARLTRMQSLADKVPGQLEGALAVARAALDAREFAAARTALAPYVSVPTRRVATLMAQIEETEHGDEGRVREWMGRAMRAAGDPVWTADGVVSDRWLPVSPNGRLDGYEWRVPLAEIGMTHPVIDAAPPPLPEPKVVAETPPEPVPPVEAAPEPEKPAAEVVPLRKAQKPAPRPAPVEAVIPLVHAPDDPGPDSGLDADPSPETTKASVNSPWRRFVERLR
jgi:HemY protein